MALGVPGWMALWATGCVPHHLPPADFLPPADPSQMSGLPALQEMVVSRPVDRTELVKRNARMLSLLGEVAEQCTPRIMPALYEPDEAALKKPRSVEVEWAAVDCTPLTSADFDRAYLSRENQAGGGTNYAIGFDKTNGEGVSAGYSLPDLTGETSADESKVYASFDVLSRAREGLWKMDFSVLERAEPQLRLGYENLRNGNEWKNVAPLTPNDQLVVRSLVTDAAVTFNTMLSSLLERPLPE